MQYALATAHLESLLSNIPSDWRVDATSSGVRPVATLIAVNDNATNKHLFTK